MASVKPQSRTVARQSERGAENRKNGDVLTPHAIYPYPYQTKKAPKMTMKKKSTAQTRRISARLPLYLLG